MTKSLCPLGESRELPYRRGAQAPAPEAAEAEVAQRDVVWRVGSKEVPVRYPDAIWRGTDKHGYGNAGTHLQNGVVIHSMEGSLQAGFGVLDGPRQASWHFSVSQTGEVYQHVDTDNIAWTNGGFDANRLFWGIECEGVEGEPLTEPQFAALLGVVRWLWDVHDVGAFVRQETAFEHNEMVQFGSAPTACPSGRIPWERVIHELEGDPAEPIEEDEMKPVLINTASDGTHYLTDWMSRWAVSAVVLEQLRARNVFEGGSVDTISEEMMAAIPKGHSGGSGLTREETIGANQEAARRGTD